MPNVIAQTVAMFAIALFSIALLVIGTAALIELVRLLRDMRRGKL
jgi:hypothetical protein